MSGRSLAVTLALGAAALVCGAASAESDPVVATGGPDRAEMQQKDRRHECKTQCGEEDAELPGFDCPDGKVCCLPPRAPVETCDGTCRSECKDGEIATTRGCGDKELCCKPR